MKPKYKEQFQTSECKYYIKWFPEYKYPTLQNEINSTLKQILTDICNKYRYEIKELEITQEYIYILIECPQTIAPLDIARTLKSMSTIKLVSIHPEFRQFYKKHGKLWSEKHIISTTNKP